MAKHQRLALPRALAAAVVASVLVAAVPSSDANLAHEPSPIGSPISKRQGNPRPSVLDSLFSNLPPAERPTSFAFGAMTIVTTTTTTSSSTLSQTITTPPSVPSTAVARPDPAPTTSTSTSTSTPTSASRFTTTTIPAAPTTTATTTSRTSSSTSSASTTSTSTAFSTTTSVDITPVLNSRPDATLSTTALFVPTYSRSATQSASVDDNQGTSDSSSGSKPSDTGFMQNKGAVGATFTVVGLVGAGLIICAVLFIRKRMRDRNSDKSDWDEVNDSAPMAMFASASARTGGGTGGTVMLPSAALAHPLSIGGHGSDPHEMDQDHPDSVLAMPPVMNYERIGDPAYNTVPVVPPQLRNQGKHSSFGSMVGGDPFAGGPAAPWQEAERDSVYGPGQAGRGAGMNALQGSGYNMQPYSGGAGVPGGSEEDAYGGTTYGSGNQESRYAYPSHAYAQQYTSNSQQGGYGYGYGY